MKAINQVARPFVSKGLRLFAAVLILATVTPQILNIKPVFADDGAYPRVGASCVDGTDCTNTTPSSYNWGYTLTSGQCPSADTSCLSYPYPSSPPYTAGMGDPWSMGVRNCTSYVAWKLNQVFNQNIISSSWKNADNWDAYATTHGYSNDSSPQVGDIAQWNGTTNNPYGHVAYVYAVNGSTASFDEYNSGYPKNGSSFQWGLFYNSFTSANYPSAVGPPNNYIHIGSLTTPAQVSAFQANNNRE